MKKIYKILLISIILLMLAGCKNKTNLNKPNDDNTPLANINSGIIEEKTVDGVNFTNISLIYYNGMSTLNIDGKNISNENKYIEYISVELKDENGKEIITFVEPSEKNLPVGESNTFSFSTDINLLNAQSLDIKINK